MIEKARVTMAVSDRPMKKTHWTVRLLKIEGQVFLALLLGFLFLLAYGTLSNRWYHVLYIYSGSMLPTFAPGDLIVITPPPEVLEPGMVLTLSVNGQLVTHRLVQIDPDGTLITKGDNNRVEDDWSNSRVAVVGLYRFSVPYLGYLADLKSLFHPAASGAWFSADDSIAFSLSTGENESLTGTSIKADLTADGFFDQNSSNYGVNGVVCVTNQGLASTENLMIQAQVEAKFKGSPGYQPLAGAVFDLQPTDPIVAGKSRCYDYSINFSPTENSHYRVAATVTITNHSGWQIGGPHCSGPDLCPFGPTEHAVFELPDDPEPPQAKIILPSTSPTPEPEPTATVLPQPTTAPTAISSPTSTATPLPVITPSPSPTSVIEPSQTPTPTTSGTPDPTQTPVPTGSPAPTQTPVPTGSLEPDQSPTSEFTATMEPLQTQTPTSTNEPVATTLPTSTDPTGEPPISTPAETAADTAIPVESPVP